MRCVMHVSNVALLVLPLALASQQPSASPGLPAAPGRLVDMGGQRLHLNCTGRGSPTVVFENGAGDFSVVWSFVQPGVGELTRACSYDRAGYAWSDPGNRPRTYDQIALELHTALERAGERGPFVLVGQSYGGLLVRGYARAYPRDVAGIVQVEAVQEDERITMGGKPQRIRDFATGRVRPEPRLAPDSALLRLRLSGRPASRDTTPLEPPLDRLPRSQQDVWRLASADSVYRLTWAAEMDWSPEELQRMHVERERDRATLGDLPLVVISRAQGSPDDSLAAERAARQRDLVALSHRGTHVVATHAGHNIHIEEPPLVVRAIRDIVGRVRHAGSVRKENDNNAEASIFLNENATQPRAFDTNRL
jgi:pimeloyl-ACP methyl ester carboxylesterase